MEHDDLKQLLDQLTQGARTVDSVIEMLASTCDDVAETPDACVDVERASRCGFPEVIFGPGKTNEAIVAIVTELMNARQDVLATRVSPEQVAAVKAKFPELIANDVARTLRLRSKVQTEPAGFVTVVSAGTSDRPVAEEAVETLRWMNCRVELIVDVGVAGPQRLLRHVPLLKRADACVVVAGMEGALASVVAGHLSCPVFAVPTSIGYGANFGGLAALLSMLNSCVANVAVVNIDAGFRAGYLAGLVARKVARD